MVKEKTTTPTEELSRGTFGRPETETETPVDDTPKKTDAVTFKVFVACAPGDKDPPLLREFTWAALVVHNHYNYWSAEGRKTYKLLHPGAQQGDFVENSPLNFAALTDSFSISRCDVVVYDHDSNPGYHLLALAAAHLKPVIVSSVSMVSPPSYFANVFSVVRPHVIGRFTLDFLVSHWSKGDWAPFSTNETRSLFHLP